MDCTIWLISPLWWTLNDTLVALAYFFVALLTAHMQMEFLKAREERRAISAANIDLLVTVLHSVPTVLLVLTHNWQVFLAEAAANWIATYFGVTKLRKGL